MKGRKHTIERIISRLREAEVALAKGQPVGKVVSTETQALVAVPDRTRASVKSVLRRIPAGAGRSRSAAPGRSSSFSRPGSAR